MRKKENKKTEKMAHQMAHWMETIGTGAKHQEEHQSQKMFLLNKILKLLKNNKILLLNKFAKI